MRFLVLGLSGRVPDAKTVWLFRERLAQAGAIEDLFNRFDTTLRNASYLPMSGQILEVTLVAAPKQRNTNAEKADLRAVLRLAAGKQAEPTTAIIDSRTLGSTPESGSRAGYDGAARKKGSKLHMEGSKNPLVLRSAL